MNRLALPGIILLGLASGAILATSDPGEVFKTCSKTDDINYLCDHETNRSRVVPSQNTCGTDDNDLLERGWERCSRETFEAYQDDGTA